MKPLFLGTALLFVACATHPPRTAPAPLLTHDDDRHPIAEPEPYESSLHWDAADQMLFLPLHRALLVDVGGPAVNVNAFGEVPSSSWFTNRIGRNPISPERLVRGPCREDDYLSEGPWLAKSGKRDGAHLGFVIEDGKSHKKYLVKLDSTRQPERGTAADVIVSKLYWAFGANAPCNFIVEFDPATIQLATEASETAPPLTQQDLDEALAKARRTPSGKLRASASLVLEGKPIGPWTYQGRRKDDFNDVIDHEDRREVRGSRLLAAWTQHFDAREQNTLSTFIKADDGVSGWVEHWFIDFGDCFGSVWAWDDLSRRFGHAYYLDFGDVVADLATFGFRKRVWEDLEKDPSAEVFGYYDVEHFDPAAWKSGYQNIAFSRMDEADGYWAAQIVSHFSDRHIDALVEAGRFSDPAHEARLREVLLGRRDRIVDHYMTRMSAFEDPTIGDRGLCFQDALVRVGRAVPGRYEIRYDGGTWQSSSMTDATICAPLDVAPALVEARVTRAGASEPAAPVAFHLSYDDHSPRLIGLERKTP